MHKTGSYSESSIYAIIVTMQKRILLALFISLFCAGFSTAEKIVLPINAEETLRKTPVDMDFVWDEKLFGSVSPTVYNHDLARIACALAEVSYVNLKTDPELEQAKNVYKKLGVSEDKMEFHYDVDYDAAGLGKNQTAFSFASKQINSGKGKRTLVFVTVRGTPQDASEWISNVNIGDSVRTATKFHEGFFQAEQQVHSALIYYLLKNKYSPDETFFLITGHSRGAAVANLLGANLCKTGYFNTENLFVYTFAAPNVSTEDDVFDPKYNFIWNIINPEDVVPTVPLRHKKWDYKKYGQVKVFVNRWNTNSDTFNLNFLPKINQYYNLLMNRNYCPFNTGSFIPQAITRLITDLYPDVKNYYNTTFGLRSIAEKVFEKMFPEEDKEAEKQKKGLPAIVTSLQKTLNRKTDGFFDYSEFAFLDMHICSTYLSWLMALEESEIYSEQGSSRIVIQGACEAAVFDSEDHLVMKILDGLPVFESIELPVIGFSFFSGTVIGFPSCDKYKIVIYKDSILPTKISVHVEHYTAEGYMTESCEKTNLWPHRGTAYVFEAGKETLSQTEISAEKDKSKDTSVLVKESKIRQRNIFRVQPEFSISTDANLEFGCRFGTRAIHGTVLTDFTPPLFGNQVDLNFGVGHESTLFSQVLIGLDLFGKCMWVTKPGLASDDRFNFVPAARISLSYKPFRRSEFFLAGNFDFRIKDFNEDAFRADVRKESMREIKASKAVQIVPSIIFGFRY